MDPILLKLPVELFNPAAHRSYEGAIPPFTLNAGADAYEFTEPVHWTVNFTNTGDALLATGVVSGSARTACGRCLKAVDVPLAGEVEGFYLIDGEEAPDDLEGDEYEVLDADRVIDLAPLLMSALRLEVPLVPLCKPDCRGLCPECGADLNEETCRCDKDSTPESAPSHNPFSVLKDFEFED